jgi:hypothetical protein
VKLAVYRKLVERIGKEIQFYLTIGLTCRADNSDKNQEEVTSFR